MAHIIEVTKTNNRIGEEYHTPFSINADRIVEIVDIDGTKGSARIKMDTGEVFDVRETREQLEKLINNHLSIGRILS